jgi:hypothetical protein
MRKDRRRTAEEARQRVLTLRLTFIAVTLAALVAALLARRMGLG